MDEKQVTYARQLLQVLARRLGCMQKDCIRCYDVTFSHSHVIYEVKRHPGISLGELAGLLGLDDSTTSRHVKSLIAQGLLAGTASEGDRRQLALQVTGPGQELYQQIATTMAAYIRDLFEQVPAEKRSQVIESLDIITAAMGKIPTCCSGPR
ncbi:MAG TPA: MarR family transcriptional regulator [Spirochaetia bacterium]|nr:MarR family transcriptional regulator [Spirochaetia bacterium]